MYRYAVFVLALFGVCLLPALASEVPPLTAAELGGPASNIWLILAGESIWGVVVVGIVGFVYRIARPYILAWMGERKLGTLYLAAEACASDVNATYVEGMKAANADGKLTEDEKAFVLAQCKQRLIIFMQTQGVDIIKEYGDVVVNAVIELIVSRIKNPVARAVAAPLSDSAPLPESVSLGATPA